MGLGRAHPVRRIGIIALPGVQLLDVSGPADVFAEANVQNGADAYTVSLLALSRAPVRSSSGLSVLPHLCLAEAARQPFDTLLVAGAPHLGAVPRLPELADWLRREAPRARRFGSICTGALPLAETGLLDNRRVTTHWAVETILSARFPAVQVEADALHVRDGPVRTAAGVTAGLDLALALVEEDLGREVARRVAAQLVMFFKRPGGQRQFSRQNATSPSGRSVLQEVQRWVAAHPAAEAGLEVLAARAGLSPRHFARVFRAEVGSTPAAWVEATRLDAARRLLEDGEVPKQVASACGFSDVDTFRRAFGRQIGVSPAEYRRQHGAARTAAPPPPRSRRAVPHPALAEDQRIRGRVDQQRRRDDP